METEMEMTNGQQNEDIFITTLNRKIGELQQEMETLEDNTPQMIKVGHELVKLTNIHSDWVHAKYTGVRPCLASTIEDNADDEGMNLDAGIFDYDNDMIEGEYDVDPITGVITLH